MRVKDKENQRRRRGARNCGDVSITSMKFHKSQATAQRERLEQDHWTYGCPGCSGQFKISAV